MYVRPIANAGKLSIELSGTVSANQGQISFNQYDSTMSNINAVVGNSTPTGDVTISGSVAVDQVLSASHNLADEDGIGVASYEWLRDGVEISNAVNDTYTLTIDDINKAISVRASYTDDASNDETVVSSAQTLTQSEVNKPLMFSSTLVTAAEASIEKHGADYSENPDEMLIRLVLEADMARFADSNITSIAGLELDFSLDWTKIEDFTYSGGYGVKFLTYENYTGSMFNGIVTDSSTGEIEKIVLSSLNTDTKPYLTLVDTVDTNAGEQVVNPTEDLITIYLNPVDTVKDFEVIFGGEISINQGDDSFTQLSHSYEVQAKTFDAIISTGSTDTTITKLHNTSINLWEDGSDTGSSVAVDTGEISIGTTVTFDEVKLSDAGAYTPDIDINDALQVLRDIVNLVDLTGHAFHAADVDNDNDIDIQDALFILRDIVNLTDVDTFDLIDADNDRVTLLDADSISSAPTWTLVANGDVDMGGSFDNAYVVTSDLV